MPIISCYTNWYLISIMLFVESSYGKVSDTDELLCNSYIESESQEQLGTSCTAPPRDIQNSNSYQQTQISQNISVQSQQQPQHLNLERFSCDVSVEGGVDKKGQERQEFSFTLYDFDGYGKITKDVSISAYKNRNFML